MVGYIFSRCHKSKPERPMTPEELKSYDRLMGVFFWFAFLLIVGFVILALIFF